MLVTFVDDVFVRLTLRESFLERSIPRTSKGLPEPCVCSVLIDKNSNLRSFNFVSCIIYEKIKKYFIVKCKY